MSAPERHGSRRGRRRTADDPRPARGGSSAINVSDADIQRCIDAPDEVSPDETTPSRTRFRRGSLVVLSGADGMVLRVQRQGGTARPAPRRSRKG